MAFEDEDAFDELDENEIEAEEEEDDDDTVEIRDVSTHPSSSSLSLLAFLLML
jgi:hypothetical protein